MLKRLNIIDWNLFKVIISNRDKKFLSKLWAIIFKKLDVKFFYFIVYHFQTNDQSKRTNQIVEIILRFHMIIMKNSIQWSKILFKIQRHINNVSSSIIDKNSNEIVYDFIFLQTFDLWKSFANLVVVDANASLSFDLFFDANFSFVARTRVKITNFIVFAQMKIKRHYDDKLKSIYMRKDDYVLIKLHHEYDISSIAILEFKLSQQFVDSFCVLERVRWLVYRLKLFSHWRIYSILFIAQLESISSSNENSFRRHKIESFDFVFVENDTNKIKSYEIERLVNKRQIARRDSKYLIRWKDCEFENDDWKNLFELNNALNLVDDYEKIKQRTFILSDRLTIKNTLVIKSKVKTTFKRKSERSSKKLFAIISSTTLLSSTFFVVKSFVNQKFVVVVRKFFASLFMISSTTTLFDTMITKKSFATFVVDFSIRRSSRLLLKET